MSSNATDTSWKKASWEMWCQLDTFKDRQTYLLKKGITGDVFEEFTRSFVDCITKIGYVFLIICFIFNEKSDTSIPLALENV